MDGSLATDSSSKCWLRSRIVISRPRSGPAERKASQCP